MKLSLSHFSKKQQEAILASLHMSENTDIDFRSHRTDAPKSGMNEPRDDDNRVEFLSWTDKKLNE